MSMARPSLKLVDGNGGYMELFESTNACQNHTIIVQWFM